MTPQEFYDQLNGGMATLPPNCPTNRGLVAGVKIKCNSRTFTGVELPAVAALIHILIGSEKGRNMPAEIREAASNFNTMVQTQAIPDERQKYIRTFSTLPSINPVPLETQ